MISQTCRRSVLSIKNKSTGLLNSVADSLDWTEISRNMKSESKKYTPRRCYEMYKNFILPCIRNELLDYNDIGFAYQAFLTSNTHLNLLHDHPEEQNIRNRFFLAENKEKTLPHKDNVYAEQILHPCFSDS